MWVSFFAHYMSLNWISNCLTCTLSLHPSQCHLSIYTQTVSAIHFPVESRRDRKEEKTWRGQRSTEAATPWVEFLNCIRRPHCEGIAEVSIGPGDAISLLRTRLLMRLQFACTWIFVQSKIKSLLHRYRGLCSHEGASQSDIYSNQTLMSLNTEPTNASTAYQKTLLPGNETDFTAILKAMDAHEGYA